MSLLAQRRAYLAAYRRTADHAAAAAEMGLEPTIHEQWLKDWTYRGAFKEVEKEMRQAVAPPPAPPKRPPGRPRKALPAPEAPKRPRGRPPKSAPTATPSAECPAPPQEPAQEPSEPPGPPPEAPKLEERLFPGDRGYVKLFVPEGAEVEPPAEPERPKRQAQEPAPEPSLDIAVATDQVQRALIDEYGELDRRMQLRATDTARYESLKKAIKNWFAAVPPDCDGCAEGDVYLLHLSACERVRTIRSVREVVEIVGLDAVLDMAVVPLGALENLIGKARTAQLTVESRSGSRRIKAIPKRAAAAM